MDKFKEENAGLRDEHPGDVRVPVAAGQAAEAVSRRRSHARARTGGHRRRSWRSAGPRPARWHRTSHSFTRCTTPGFWIDGTDPDLTMLDIRPGEPRDLHVLPGGNVAKPGERSRRADSCRCCPKGDPKFHEGSGRLRTGRHASSATPRRWRRA